jgi:PKD repeat protein
VDYTEYRVKTGDDQGDWVKAANTGGADPFASEVTVSAEGQHTVEYRSVDKAGNVEDAQSVSFGIENPEPGTPVIEAFADPETGTAPLEVRFSATGFDPDGGELSYKWEFEDGVYYGRARTRTYTKPGEYTAKVTATDDEGDTTSKEVTVTVKRAGAEPPTLEAGSDVTSVEAGGAEHFTATGTDPDGPEDDLLYTWDFGDGGSSFEQNPSHTYAEPGTYTAKVTVSDGAGASAEKTIEITVTDPAGNQAPTVEAGADRNTGTAPLNVTFTAQATDADGDTLTYEWDFADGSAKANGREVDHTYTDAGTYDAKVTVSDGNGGSTTATVRVVVGDPPGNQAPSVEATADPKSGTSPLTVHFSGQARDPEGEGLIATWDFGDGGRAAGLSATHVYTAAGTYTATLTVRDPKGGQATASVQVTVSAAQAAPRTPAPSAVAPAAVVPAEAAPEQPAWFGVAEPESTTIGKFAKRGLRVKVTCTEAMRGNVKLKVSRKLARKLGLKHRTLAKRSLKCRGAGSKSLKLKASKKVRRALRHSKGSVRITLQVRLRASGESTKQSKSRITLKRHR